MAEEAFELEYDGPAVADNELDARDFATAVLNAAELFHELNNLAYPGSSDLGVNIKAPTAGSFGVVLKILVDTEGMLNNAAVIAANNLSALITTFGGLLRFAKRRRGSQVVERVDTPSGTSRVKLANGDELEVPTGVLNASESIRVRQTLAEVTRPLTRAGVETLVVRQNEIEIERVDKADAAAIRQSEVSPTPQLTDLPPTDRDTWLVLEAVTFKRGNKSRFSEGGPPFSARITDQDFLDRIDSGEPFRKNDRFRVVLRQQQRLTDSGIKSRYDIVRVLEHIPTGQQQRLDLPHQVVPNPGDGIPNS